MKIAILDGYTLNPGDLNGDELRALGDCAIYDRTPPGQVVERSSGGAVGQIARAFGMNVVVHQRRPPHEGGTSFVDLDTLFSRSDVVSLHCPLNPSSRHLVNAARLGRMKATAYLVNTARGGLVNEPDL